MHYLSHDGNFFPSICQISYLSFIHEISMSNLHTVPKCFICTCLHVVTGTGQYWYDNNAYIIQCRKASHCIL